MMEPEENLLRGFIVSCLRGDRESTGYLHFKVADILPIQNLVENLIWTIRNKLPNKRSINQVTMGLLFLQLMNHMDKIETEEKSSRQRLIISVLNYIETHYWDGELVQAKRLNQASYLLTTTSLSVMEIASMVGYDNISYFHRIFKKRYQMSPRKYRLENGVISSMHVERESYHSAANGRKGIKA